jgi:hypothetical protein
MGHEDQSQEKAVEQSSPNTKSGRLTHIADFSAIVSVKSVVPYRQCFAGRAWAAARRASRNVAGRLAEVPTSEVMLAERRRSG